MTATRTPKSVVGVTLPSGLTVFFQIYGDEPLPLVDWPDLPEYSTLLILWSLLCTCKPMLHPIHRVKIMTVALLIAGELEKIEKDAGISPQHPF